jgi:HAD superfamily hydrolase (TIGR01509 family)
MIRGLIFDFDGLILETEGPVYQSWVEFYQEFGAELPMEVWSGIIGTSNTEHLDIFNLLEDTIGHKLDRAALAPRRAARELEICLKQPILPGVVEKIHKAHELGLHLGIASSSNREWVVGHLTRLGLAHYFNVIHTSEDVERTKPDPALYRLALSSLSLKPAEAIVFEDSPNGVAAAKANGIFTVAVPNEMTRQLNLSHADLILGSLAELSLAEIIQRAEQRSNGSGQGVLKGLD